MMIEEYMHIDLLLILCRRQTMRI